MTNFYQLFFPAEFASHMRSESKIKPKRVSAKKKAADKAYARRMVNLRLGQLREAKADRSSYTYTYTLRSALMWRHLAQIA